MSVPVPRAGRRGSGFFSVLRLYPDRNLAVVTMANTTCYHHTAVLDAMAQLRW